MSASTAVSPRPLRRALFALATYLVVVIGLTTAAAVLASDLLESAAALEENRATLAHLERQLERGAPAAAPAGAAANGPPFLAGKTVTVAGAALQERVEAIVKQSGGAVLSSQIELQGPRAAEGFVGVTESLEIDQASLQPALYDLESGMPYLFVESLAIQSPQVFGEAEGARMRVLITVSGQWREDR
jgi:general secretion pathway protein M